MKSNSAAWIVAPNSSPLQVKPAPYPYPGPRDVVVKVAAVAINPLEYKIQDHNPPIGGRQIDYPTILGADLAGTIVSVGTQVTRHKVGDNVMANAPGYAIGNPAMSAFQHFVALPEHFTTPIPDNLTFEAASVLPLGCDTAMAGLFSPDQLGLSLKYMGDGVSTPPKTGSVVLIWGGSSSVGCCAIQMATAAGYEVFAVASVRNHALCTSIGAKKVFDQSAASVEDDIVEAIESDGGTIIGALDCVGDWETTTNPCGRILARTNGFKKVVTVLSPPETKLPGNVEVQRLSIPALHSSKAYSVVHAWMTTALHDGTLLPKPDPKVVGEGLDSIQRGIDIVRKGVSAAKVVVRL